MKDIKDYMTGTKRLYYAYLTSSDAERYGGNWLVFVDGGLSKAFHDNERWEALKHFESFDLPYSKTESFDRNSTPFINKE